jgi:hypothetical protein
MAKGAEKSSPCMLSRHVVHLGILKWTRMRESSPLILKLDKSLSHLRNLRANLKHYQDAKFIQMYRRSSCKIVSTKTKQTITNNDLVVDLPTKIWL